MKNKTNFSTKVWDYSENGEHTDREIQRVPKESFIVARTNTKTRTNIAIFRTKPKI